MAQECGFFNAHLEGEEFDRVYLAEQFAAYFAAFIGNGVYGNSMQKLQVLCQDVPDMSIKVLSGEAYTNGWWYRNTDIHNISVPIADGVLSRIDVVVVRWGSTERDMWLHLIKGTPSAKPVKPPIRRDSDYYDLQLATIEVPAGALRITQAQIKDTRLDNAVCGLVTGVVDQIDTTNLYNQFEAYFKEFKEKYEADYDQWTKEQKQAYNDFVTATQLAYEQWTTEQKQEYIDFITETKEDYEDWVLNRKNEYDQWTAQKMIEYTQFVSTSEQSYTDYIENKKDAYDSFVSQMESDYNEWTTAQKAEYEEWTAEQKAEYEEWYETHTTAWTQEFTEWFESIRNMLTDEPVTLLYEHVNNKENPHEVTKEQIPGLEETLNELNQKIESITDNITYEVMTGATISTDGKSGLVPVPVAGKQYSFLRGDGIWAIPQGIEPSILTNQDLDSIIASGFYYAEPNNLVGSSDLPINVGEPFGLEVIKSGKYKSVIQILYTNIKTYKRYIDVSSNMGRDVYMIGQWDENVRGIKGNAESSYRTGYVNITPKDIGALPTSGGTMTGQLIEKDGSCAFVEPGSPEGNARYARILHIEILKVYASRPITLKVGEDVKPYVTDLVIGFKNVNNKDPEVYSFLKSGNVSQDFALVHTSESNWDLYVDRVSPLRHSNSEVLSLNVVNDGYFKFTYPNDSTDALGVPVYWASVGGTVKTALNADSVKSIGNNKVILAPEYYTTEAEEAKDFTFGMYSDSDDGEKYLRSASISIVKELLGVGDTNANSLPEGLLFSTTPYTTYKLLIKPIYDYYGEYYICHCCVFTTDTKYIDTSGGSVTFILPGPEILPNAIVAGERFSPQLNSYFLDYQIRTATSGNTLYFTAKLTGGTGVTVKPNISFTLLIPKSYF